jgi:acetyl-CoA carboxylase biotin carboxyl carrier protein
MAKTAVISPIPGVFYRRPSPEKDPFVMEGQPVKAGDTIGLIEVMKNFYEIKAEADGIVESFLVEDEVIVEAGQEIALIKTE